jgi:hypothetical protein
MDSRGRSELFRTNVQIVTNALIKGDLSVECDQWTAAIAFVRPVPHQYVGLKKMAEEIPYSEQILKDRSTGLLVFGILEILLGAFLALMVPLMLVGTLATAALGDGSAPPVAVNTLVPGLLFYGVLAIWFIWMGIGSLKARRWARALVLVTSSFWLLAGLWSLVVMLFLSPGIYDEMPEEMAGVMKFMMFGFLSVCYVIMPGTLILFYRSKHVKATCERRDPRIRWTDKCPLPVLALSLVFGCGAVNSLCCAFYGWAVPFFGGIQSGVTGAVIVIINAFLLCYVSRGLYRLSLRGWWSAVLLVVAWGISSAITFSRVGLMAFYEKMNMPPDQLVQMEQLAQSLGPWMVTSSIVSVVLVLAYLLFVRRYFPHTNNASPWEQPVTEDLT